MKKREDFLNREKVSQEKFSEKKVILNLKYKKEGVFSV